MLINGTRIAITIRIAIDKPPAIAIAPYFTFLDDLRKLVFL